MARWSKTPPKYDGYYWHRISVRHRPEILFVCRDRVFIGTLVEVRKSKWKGEWTRHVKDHGGEWYGERIEEPAAGPRP